MLAFGGAIGSFLNVVVYRCPRGLSIVHPGSQCPRCGHAIRARDNIPVLAWLWLRGRCRDCQAPISARYPTIELVVALLFASLGWIEVIQSGGGVAVSAIGSVTATDWPFEWRCGIWAFQLLPLCTVFAVALIHFDGLSAPRGIWYLAIIVGVTAPIIWPWLLPATPSGIAVDSPIVERTHHIIGTVLIAVVALLVHSLVKRFKTTSSSSQEYAFTTVLLTLGFSLSLGTRAGVAIVLVSLLLYLGSGLALGRNIPVALISVGIVWGWLLAWPALCDSFPLLGPAATHSQTLLLAGGGAVGIGLLAPFSARSKTPTGT